MTFKFPFCFLVFQVAWPRVPGLCYFSCPRGTDTSQSLCGVDVKRGAKLFGSKCLLLRENHCLSSDYREMEMQQCLKNHPEVVPDFISSHKYDLRFDKFRSVLGIRLLPRYLILFNFITRIALSQPKPWPIPIYPPFNQPQLPFPFWPILTP